MFDKFNTFEELQILETVDDKNYRTMKESEHKLEIKRIITYQNKYNFENLTNVKKEYISCQNRCYKKIDVNAFTNKDINGLLSCKNTCKLPLNDLYAFYDNVNFLSEVKLNECTKNCENKSIKEAYNQMYLNELFYDCAWICYNKLDRRYGGYWKEKKDKLLARHFHTL